MKAIRWWVMWVVMSMLAVGAACQAQTALSWEDAQASSGSTEDAHGDVLIIGGNVNGPSDAGGEATWTLDVGSKPITQLSFSILTQGAHYRGKGIHATQPDGAVDIYVNEVLVHTIICTEPGGYGDYWPATAPIGSGSYASGLIDVAGQGIQGPTLRITLVAQPFTAIDINALKVTVNG